MHYRLIPLDSPSGIRYLVLLMLITLSQLLQEVAILSTKWLHDTYISILDYLCKYRIAGSLHVVGVLSLVICTLFSRRDDYNEYFIYETI